jgi:hypothetical protein
MKDVADAMRGDVRAEYPMSEFGQSISTDRRRQARADAEEIVETAKYMIDSGQDPDGRAQDFIDAYQVFADLNAAKAETGKGSPERKMMNETWRSWVTEEGMPLFEGDQRGLRFLRILSSALDAPVEGL